MSIDRDETPITMVAPVWAWEIILSAIRADIVDNVNQAHTYDLIEAEAVVREAR